MHEKLLKFEEASEKVKEADEDPTLDRPDQLTIAQSLAFDVYDVPAKGLIPITGSSLRTSTFGDFNATAFELSCSALWKIMCSGNHFKALGVSREATPEQVQTA